MEDQSDWGLACPPDPFTEQDLQLADQDISTLDDFLRGLDDDGDLYSLNHNTTKKDDVVPVRKHNIPVRKHGIGKQMELVVQFYKPPSTRTNITTDNSSSKQFLSELKFDSAKRKLHDNYQHIATEKKRRRTQLITLSELPPLLQLNGSGARCHGRGRGRGRVAPTFSRSNIAACH